jgi:hypothetical protein
MMKITDDMRKKYRRPGWLEGRYVQWSGFRLFNQDGKRIFNMLIEEVLADDWEVVEEKQDIEVGDVVSVNNHSMFNRDDELTVVWQRKTSTVVMVQYKTDIHHKVNIKDLTLIRKGPKKEVLENVRITGTMDGLKLKGYSNDAGLSTAARYQVTFKEMPDEGGK